MSKQFDVYALARIDETARDIYVKCLLVSYDGLGDRHNVYEGVSMQLAFERAEAFEGQRARFLAAERKEQG